MMSTSFQKSMTRTRDSFLQYLSENKSAKIFIGSILLFVTIFTLSKLNETSRVIYKENLKPVFSQGRILGAQKATFLRNKEAQLSKVTKSLMTSNKALFQKVESLEKQMKERELAMRSKVIEKPIEKLNAKSKEQRLNAVESNPIKISSDSNGFSLSRPKSRKSSFSKSRGRFGGPSVISFPVKHKREEKGITLPTGSYVKAKLMTGIDAPEGKTYPVLLALDFSYVGPNKHKVDLSGCFIIAKSSPSMATERINFQATRLSCVSKKGKFFERKISGFVADDSDNTFAVKAELNSKQGRVAKMAFLKTVVDGIGEIISRKAKNAGGKNPDAAGVLVQNGAQGAASRVSDWYLKQVTSLMPTLSVSSGQDVWVVMQEKVLLPNDFFRKNQRRNKNEKVFSYLTRIID